MQIHFGRTMLESLPAVQVTIWRLWWSVGFGKRPVHWLPGAQVRFNPQFVASVWWLSGWITFMWLLPARNYGPTD